MSHTIEECRARYYKGRFGDQCTKQCYHATCGNFKWRHLEDTKNGDRCTAFACKPNPLSPEYYSSLSPEPFEVIEGWNLPFHLGAAIKYIARAGKKDPTKTKEDLQKAISYLQRYIDHVAK